MVVFKRKFFRWIYGSKSNYQTGEYEKRSNNVIKQPLGKDDITQKLRRR